MILLTTRLDNESNSSTTEKKRMGKIMFVGKFSLLFRFDQTKSAGLILWRITQQHSAIVARKNFSSLSTFKDKTKPV